MTRMEVKTVFGRKIEIDTQDITYSVVKVGTGYYHLSKLFYENGTSLIDLAWSE
jgi:hypothetical protein